MCSIGIQFCVDIKWTDVLHAAIFNYVLCVFIYLRLGTVIF